MKQLGHKRFCGKNTDVGIQHLVQFAENFRIKNCPPTGTSRQKILK